jgi:CshA-type fibril repeat protein
VVDATVFPTAGQPPSAAVSADGKSVSVPGQGTWMLLADGSALFTPTSTYAGTTTPVTYRVVDTTGLSSTATLRVTVQHGPAGHALVLSVPGDYGGEQVVLLDAPGRNADGTLGSIDAASVRIATHGQPKGWTVASDGHRATYGTGDQQIVVEADVDGFVFLAPGYDVTATPGPLTYSAQNTVLDATGAVRHHALRSTVQASLTHPTPTATDDHADTTSSTPVYLAGPSNDPTPSGSLDPDKTTFPSDQLDRLPVGSTVSSDGRTLKVPGEGVYSGGDTIYFVPAKGFLGQTTPVRYQVSDEWGNTARATVTVTVRRPPVARPDAATTARHHAVTVDVAANDDPGHLLLGYGEYTSNSRPFAQLPIHRLPTGWKSNGVGTELTVPGQGVYVADLGSTAVTFTPEPQFSGTTTPITLDLGQLYYYGPELTSILTITVTASDPHSVNDVVTTGGAQPTIIPVLANDSAGPGAALVGSSVQLRLTPDLPSGSTLYRNAKTLIVPGHGAFLVAGDGEITFVPIGTTPGAVPGIEYQVSDINGTTTRSTVAVTVR